MFGFVCRSSAHDALKNKILSILQQFAILSTAFDFQLDGKFYDQTKRNVRIRNIKLQKNYLVLHTYSFVNSNLSPVCVMVIFLVRCELKIIGCAADVVPCCRRVPVQKRSVNKIRQHISKKVFHFCFTLL